MLYDVKLTRGLVISIIAGPYESNEEAQMHATRLKLESAKIGDNETIYEVVDHVPNGI